MLIGSADRGKDVDELPGVSVVAQDVSRGRLQREPVEVVDLRSALGPKSDVLSDRRWVLAGLWSQPEVGLALHSHAAELPRSWEVKIHQHLVAEWLEYLAVERLTRIKVSHSQGQVVDHGRFSNCSGGCWQPASH